MREITIHDCPGVGTTFSITFEIANMGVQRKRSNRYDTRYYLEDYTPQTFYNWLMIQLGRRPTLAEHLAILGGRHAREMEEFYLHLAERTFKEKCR